MKDQAQGTLQSRKRDRRDEDELAQVIGIVDSVLSLVEENPQLWHRDYMQGVRRFATTVQNHPDIFPIDLPHETNGIIVSSPPLDRSILTKGVSQALSSHQNPFESVSIFDKPVVQVTTLSEKKMSAL
jgi:hypothetical protein